MKFLIRGACSFAAALQFLTVLPPLVRRPLSPQEVGQSLLFFPLVGLLLGLVLIALEMGLGVVLSPGPRSSLLIAAWVVLTGALHLDGLMDTCDGVFGGASPERRLEIMRDRQVGAFGIAAAVVLLILKFSALASLTGTSRVAALLAAPFLGRWALVWTIRAYSYPREVGVGRAFKDYGRRRDVVLTGLFVAVVMTFLGWRGLLFWSGAFLTSWIVALFISRRVGGLTGDAYGAITETVETATLLLASAVR